MDIQSNILSFEELVYGGKHYKTILQVLRDSLTLGLESKLKEKYGAIAFFKYDIESEGIKMNFFPLFPDVIDLNFPDDEKIKLDYLQKINEDRPVSQIYYVEHFKKTYNCTEHTVLEVEDDKDLLNHTKEKINGVSWTNFISQKDLVLNRLDFLFFKKRQKTFTLFPLPVLCSPCILLFLPYNDKLGIDELTPHVRDAINNYVFNRLMSEIGSDLKLAAILTREAFIKRFIDEFNQVALPIKFEFKGKEENFIDWYGEFKTNDAAELELNLDGEVVKFFLPSFCWHTGELLHTLPHYKVKEQQVKETIQNIFGLVYGYWKTINSQRGLLQDQIIPLIAELKSKSSYYDTIREGVEETNKKIEALTKLVTKLEPDKEVEMDYELKSFLKMENGIPNKFWKFRYNGETLEKEAKEIGFDHLQYILKNPDRDIPLEELNPSLKRSAKTPDEFVELYEKADHGAKKILKRISNSGGIQSADAADVKEFALLLAQKKYAGNNLRYKVAEDSQKIGNCLTLLQKMLVEDDFKQFKEQVKSVGSTERRTEAGRADNFLKSTVSLRDKLLKKYPQIEPHFSKSVLKIGSPSSYRPQVKDKVSWNDE